MIRAVQVGERPKLPVSLSSSNFPPTKRYTSLMVHCWAENPLLRPTFKIICNELQDILIMTEKEIQREKN